MEVRCKIGAQIGALILAGEAPNEHWCIELLWALLFLGAMGFFIWCSSCLEQGPPPPPHTRGGRAPQRSLRKKGE